MSLIVDSIFTEWRASLPEGSLHPNTKNGYHLFLLKEICLKRGIPENVINNVLLTLEANDKNKDGGLDDDEIKKAKDQGLVSQGFGRWGKSKDGDMTHKTVDGKLVPAGKDDLKKQKSDREKEKTQSGTDSSTDDNQQVNDPRDMFDPNLTKTGSSKTSSDNEEKDEKPKGTPVKIQLKQADKDKANHTINKVDTVIKELEKELEDITSGWEWFDKQRDLKRLKVLKKNWTKFTNAETEEERGEAVQEMVGHQLLARNQLSTSPKAKRKVYFTEDVPGLGAKDGMVKKTGSGVFQFGADGNKLSQLISDTIDHEGLEVEMRNSSADRALAKKSGDHNEAGVVAFLDSSELNESNYKKIRGEYEALGGDHRRAHKQNEAAAQKVKKYLSELDPPCNIASAEAMGHLGNKQIKKQFGIDPKRNPTDFFVYCDDKKTKRKGISAKIYSNPKQITMKNSGTKNASTQYLGDPSIDDKLEGLKQRYNIGNEPSDDEKSDFKKAYLSLWEKAMQKLASDPVEGQQKLVNMWNEVHGCGEDVATLITNKKTGEVQLHDPDHYCNPEGPLKVKQDETKIMVNFGNGDQWVEMVCKTEKDASVKLLFNHRVK